MTEEKQETKTPDMEKESGASTIEDTKQELAKMYLNFLDKQKGGILATGAGLGITLNPLQKDAIEYLTTEHIASKEKKGIFANIGKNIEKNIKKKFIENMSKGTPLEYDKASLNKMKALITQYKNDQAKLEALMMQIEEGTDPTVVENVPTTPDQKDKPGIAPVVAPDKVAEHIETNKKYIFPLPGNIVTSAKGPRQLDGKNEDHKGIDISGTTTEIKSIGDGVVETVGLGSEAGGFNGYGNYIVVKMSNGNRVLYGHMKKIPSLKVDDKVEPGDVIGIMGSTGKSTGPHLHLEIRKGDKDDAVKFFDREVLDPLTLIPVTKNMIEPAVLAHIDQNVLDKEKPMSV